MGRFFSTARELCTRRRDDLRQIIILRSVFLLLIVVCVGAPNASSASTDPITITGGSAFLGSAVSGYDPPYSFYLTGENTTIVGETFSWGASGFAAGHPASPSGTLGFASYVPRVEVVDGITYSAFIAGTLVFTAVPFVVPSGVDGTFVSFSTPFSMTGHITGYDNPTSTGAPLFSVDVAGSGIASVFDVRTVGNGADSVYRVEGGTAYGFAPPVIDAAIEIKPGSNDPTINLRSRGVTPVAILSSPTFDATEVLPESVSLAGARVRRIGKAGRYSCSPEDVNGDGRVDLVCHVETAAFLLEPGNSAVILEAQTSAGRAVRGQQAVRIVP